MIRGTTALIAHLGYPTHSFKAPLVYNPWFEKNNVNAVVVPMGVKAEEYPEFLKYLFKLTNVRGALITMPHKITTLGLVDEITPVARIAGAANAVLLRSDGTLLGDQFDGAGFVRGAERKGFPLAGQRALVVGNGGVGSAIAASLAGAGVAALGLFDPRQEASEPVDIDRVAPGTFVGEVVMRQQLTPFLQAARDKGCPVQVGTDMLFEQIPACLEFFGFGTATPAELRAVARIGP